MNVERSNILFVTCTIHISTIQKDIFLTVVNVNYKLKKNENLTCRIFGIQIEEKSELYFKEFL